jgi:uncharacterized protein (TIGR03437 family)
VTRIFLHPNRFALAALLLLPGASRVATSADAAPKPVRAARTAARAENTTHTGNGGLRNLPLLFEPAPPVAGSATDGSADGATPSFFARGDGYELRLHGPHAEFVAGESALRLSFAGAKDAPHPEALDQQPARISYFVGNDTARWRAGVPLFGRVRYRDIYPGIDVEFYGRRGQPEFDLMVHPGADVSQIRLELEGADSIEETAPGELTVLAGKLPLRLRIPCIYQPVESGQPRGPGLPGELREEVAGGFRRLPDGAIGFVVGEHDAARPLIIDPVLSFSTLVGGIYGDNGYDVAVDAQGFIYVTGLTHELGFLHTPGAVTAPAGSSVHAFVVKLNPEGSELEYAAVIGGTREDQGRAIALDADGNVYLTGTTFSTDFPVTSNALQPQFAGGNIDIFVVKLSADGSELLYSSYLGGHRQEFGNSIAVAPDGSVYVAGSTLADDFPVLPDALQPVKSSDNYDAFLVKMDLNAPKLSASTFLGGTDRDDILDMALDPAGNVVVTGETVSKDFPTTPDAFQRENGGVTTAFVTKLTPDLSEILFSTYLGGSIDDHGQTVAVDDAGDIYVAGRTLSTDFPVTLGALQGRLVRGAFFGDAFVTKVSADGSKLIYSTYLGGSSEEEVNGIAVDGTGQATVTGGTGSNDFPLTSNAVQGAIAGLDDVFVTRLSADGSRAIYSTLLGGEKGDRTLGIAAAGPGAVVVVGTTVSPDYPATAGSLQTVVRGADAGGDALVARFDQLFAPAFSDNAIVNAASLQRGPVAPGEIVSIFGENLGPPNPVAATLTEDGLLSTRLGETRVLFDGVAAPLVFVADGQISAVVPYAVAGGGSTEVQVEFFGVLSDPVSVAVAPASPALFTQNSQGWGPAAALNQDYRLNTAENPAARGSIVILFATGEGITDQAADGVLATAPLAQPLLPITVTVGGTPAEVLYAGAAPGLVAGVMQLNVRIPDAAPTGDGVMVVVDAGEIAGARWVTLAVR